MRTASKTEEFVWAVRPSIETEDFRPVAAATPPAFAVEVELPPEAPFEAEPLPPLAEPCVPPPAACEPETSMLLPAWREASARRLDTSALQRCPRSEPNPEAEPPTVEILADAETEEAPREASPESSARPEVPTPLPGHQPAPDYPDSARRRRIGGTVLVRIAVDEVGIAAACEVLAGSGCAALDAAALDAARRWRFDHGPGAVEVPFTFRVLARS